MTLAVPLIANYHLSSLNWTPEKKISIHIYVEVLNPSFSCEHFSVQIHFSPVTLSALKSILIEDIFLKEEKDEGQCKKSTKFLKKNVKIGLKKCDIFTLTLNAVEDEKESREIEAY